MSTIERSLFSLLLLIYILVINPHPTTPTHTFLHQSLHTSPPNTNVYPLAHISSATPQFWCAAPAAAKEMCWSMRTQETCARTRTPNSKEVSTGTQEGKSISTMEGKETTSNCATINFQEHQLGSSPGNPTTSEATKEGQESIVEKGLSVVVVGSRMEELRRTTMTDYLKRKYPVKSLTGTFCEDSQHDVHTPSPHRTAAAFALRNEISWISSTMPKGIKRDWMPLVHRFVRPMPSSSGRYHLRLVEELELIHKFDFQDCFVHVLRILEHARGLPYLVRGSAAGSLVCYLLGISHIDPVREDMALARFMHSLRSDLPDIDLDFPHTHRDQVFSRLFARCSGSAARISNHMHFKLRSAKREAARRLNFRRHIPRGKSPGDYFHGEGKELYTNLTQSLVGTRSGYSLHCGGVIMLSGSETIREGDRVKPRKGFGGKFCDHQVVWDKRDCQKKKLIKIDVLSNRGLSHLWSISQKHVYEYPGEDKATAELLCRADTTGITFAESPAMKKALRMLRPSCRRDLALALAIIRPAAAGVRRRTDFLGVYAKRKDVMVFDDDAVRFLKLLLNCSEAQAEVYRKGFAKEDELLVGEVRGRLEASGLGEAEVESAMSLLASAQKYGFCKAHAMSYAHMVWALAYEKAHRKTAFWVEHARNVLEEGMNVYEAWVYKRETQLAGALVESHEQMCLDGHALSAWEQMRTWGWWKGSAFVPGCYVRRIASSTKGCEALWQFRGLYACGRLYKKKIGFVTVGVGNKLYVDVCYTPQGPWPGNCKTKALVIDGEGVMRSAFGSVWIQASTISFHPI